MAANGLCAQASAGFVNAAQPFEGRRYPGCGLVWRQQPEATTADGGLPPLQSKHPGNTWPHLTYCLQHRPCLAASCPFCSPLRAFHPVLGLYVSTWPSALRSTAIASFPLLCIGT